MRKQILSLCRDSGYVANGPALRTESGSRRRRTQRRKRLSTTDGYMDDADSGSEEREGKTLGYLWPHLIKLGLSIICCLAKADQFNLI